MAATKTRTSKPKAKPSRTSKPKAAASSSPSKPQAVREAVEETTKDASGKVAGAVSKAKVPLMAGGAALAVGAGGLALGAHQAHRKSGLKGSLAGVSSKDLAKAARRAGDVGAQVGEIALEVRRARESTNSNGHSHRSPIEVVLQSLTQRR